MDWNRLADERVMVVRLYWDGWRILFVSDAGWATERAMLEAGIDVGADVIVAGRHVHDASLGENFLRASGARAVIASHADFPVSEQVPGRWRRSTEAAGVAVFHQGESGAVVVSRDGDTLVLRGWVDGREVVLRR
jgi:beta-lactamase superfamily II metal-dependent hydrolase